MAPPQKIFVPELLRCYHCGCESNDSSFKYYDNKKADQPRYQCHNCDKFFTLGSHGRPQGKTYAKKRNEDPPELKSLSRQCCHCGVADQALFKYYNNKNLSQPRFKCLSCGNQFQMRVLGIGEERHLVHTSSLRTRAPRRRKQSVPEPFPNASNSSQDGSYQPFDGSFMPVPSDALMPLEPGARLLPEMSDEDGQYAQLLEAELAEEESTQADPFTWTANGDDGNLLSPLTNAYLHFLEAESLTEEKNEAPNDDVFSSAANVDGEFPPTWSNEDEQLMGFREAGAVALDADMSSDHMAEMVSESTSNNVEVMYGTLVVDTPAAPDLDSLSNNDTAVDPFSMSYAEAAAACCYQMDMEMAHNNSMDSDSWNHNETSVDPSSVSYADAATACCYQMDMEMAHNNSMDSDSWNHNETSVDPSSVSYADAAAACCYQMDMEMAHNNSMDSNSWSHNETSVDPSSMSYADAAAACCYQMDMEMAHNNSMLAVAPV